METTLQENKNREIIIGNLTQQNIDLVSVKRKYWTELHLLFIMKDTKKCSQKLSLFKKQLKIKKLLVQIFLVYQKILDKDKLTEVQISYMVSKISPETIHGMLLDASTESQLKKKFSQITILENQLSQIAEMS